METDVGRPLLVAHKFQCGLTFIRGEQIKLYRLGLFPVRCEYCGDLMASEGDE